MPRSQGMAESRASRPNRIGIESRSQAYREQRAAGVPGRGVAEVIPSQADDRHQGQDGCRGSGAAARPEAGSRPRPRTGRSASARRSRGARTSCGTGRPGTARGALLKPVESPGASPRSSRVLYASCRTTRRAGGAAPNVDVLRRPGRPPRDDRRREEVEEGPPGKSDQEHRAHQGGQGQRGQFGGRRQAGEEPGGREPPAGRSPIVPDPQEVVGGEEGGGGADRVVVQRLGVRQQVGAERRGDQAEEPRPVVGRVPVEQPGEEDQEEA